MCLDAGPSRRKKEEEEGERRREDRKQTDETKRHNKTRGNGANDYKWARACVYLRRPKGQGG